jgi:hypothetical protein
MPSIDEKSDVVAEAMFSRAPVSIFCHSATILLRFTSDHRPAPTRRIAAPLEWPVPRLAADL